MKKPRKKPPFYELFHFNEIWSRITSETPIRKYKELSTIIGTTPQNITKRKDENYFPPDWAFYVGMKFGLSTEWIMTGKGQIRTSDISPKKQNTFLEEIDLWLSEQIDKEPFRKEWFVGTFLDAFPTFAKWKKSQDKKERKDSTIQNKAA